MSRILAPIFTASLCSANLTVAGRYKQHIAQSYTPCRRTQTPPARPAIACGGVKTCRMSCRRNILAFNASETPHAMLP
eukprot:4850151-Heterocapsa_arctica.AAC.1